MKARIARWLGVTDALEAAADAKAAAEGASATALQAVELCHAVLDELKALKAQRVTEAEQSVREISAMRDACMKASADAIAAALRCLEAERGRQATSRPVDDDLEDALDRLGERRR